ncbi:type III pantothenate kinase [Thaumasiovibrio sp. DFM-14]|uniref:type III pantothenate kinase n=1 Tax=Thaumasiovibrio sp. DFM-14 TaxID=3384792 RepID=UPI0039A0238C
MQLLIEAGNTYVKLASLDMEGSLTQLGKYPSAQLEMVLEPYLDEGIERIVFASVGPVVIDNMIQRFSQENSIPCFHVKTRRKDFGVKNAYAEYQYLGVDRWLTLISVYQQSKRPSVIIDIGTALTFDVIDEEGRHLGGWIAPGYKLMMESVLANTSKVFSDGDHKDTLEFADSTGDGLKNGCRAALVGMIQFGIEQAKDRLNTDPEVIICGGGVRHVPISLRKHYHHRSDLVLEGLALYAHKR